MSTLTSAQLHVKRSSTRLHAPPGGASSLSFGKGAAAFCWLLLLADFLCHILGCGGLGTAEPVEETLSKDEPPASSSGRYAPTAASFGNNDSNAPDGYPSYATPQLDSATYNNYASSQHSYQQQPHQYQAPYNPNSQNSYNYGSNSFSNQGYANNDNRFQVGRPPSSTPSSRSSTRSSSSSSSWGSQPPLTSSKRDQNWEKKRRLWLARKNSSNYGDRPPSTSSSTWSSGPSGRVLDDSINPPSPLSKFMHQHAQQQQQHPPPTPGADYQRLGTASSTRSSNSSYMHHQPYPQQSFPAQTQTSGPLGYPAAGRATFSRGGLSTASSTASSSRRQPPGGQCQWTLG